MWGLQAPCSCHQSGFTPGFIRVNALAPYCADNASIGQPPLLQSPYIHLRNISGYGLDYGIEPVEVGRERDNLDSFPITREGEELQGFLGAAAAKLISHVMQPAAVWSFGVLSGGHLEALTDIKPFHHGRSIFLSYTIAGSVVSPVRSR
jgi:hypothetical protein